MNCFLVGRKANGEVWGRTFDASDDADALRKAQQMATPITELQQGIIRNENLLYLFKQDKHFLEDFIRIF